MSEKKVEETSEKETVKAETVNPDEKKQEEGGFKKWWKNTKKSVNDTILESKIESSFKNAHHGYNIYKHDGGLFNSSTCYGDIKDEALIYWGEDKIEPYSLIIDTKDNKAYYALDSEPVTVSSTVDGTVYERKGTSIKLNADVEEVDVIKGGDRYFLYKGKKKDEKK